MHSLFDPSLSIGDTVIGRDDYSVFIGQIVDIHEHEYELHSLYDSDGNSWREGTIELSFNYRLHFPLRLVTPEELELFRLLFK